VVDVAETSSGPPGISGLAELTSRFVSIPSVTGSEEALADLIAGMLSPVRRIERVAGCLVVPPSANDRPVVTLVGHLDTVPPQGNENARHADGRIHGVGAADMKGGLAVMLKLAASVPESSPLALALVFYPAEEGPLVDNGLGHLLKAKSFPPTDLAIVLEPTDSAIQMGCLGLIHAEAVFRGESAHSARPWLGKNAIHMAAGMLKALSERTPRKVIVARSLVFREVLLATTAKGGVARNVVPAEFRLNLNLRFSPDRSIEAAQRELEEFAKAHGAELEIVDACPPGPVCEGNSIVERLRQAGLGVEPKQGWTDVAQLGRAGIDAINFGPGETSLAHTAHESISVESLHRCYEVLWELLTAP
jgi:succinyl-diaminopimelate desuccinylase